MKKIFPESIYEDWEVKPYLSHQEIHNEIRRLAHEITRDYESKNPVLLAVLNGSFVFAAHLSELLDFPCQIEFINIKSYEGTASTGEVKEILNQSLNLEGRHVIIVEDIVDTGRTIDYLIGRLQAEEPLSCSVCSLLFKKEAYEYDYQVNYFGFLIEQKFVVGFGLDYNGYGRNLPEICQFLPLNKGSE